jgi:hypothetical protein
VILAILFLGPQGRDDNVVLTVFWSWWWAGSLLVYPLLGRIWCSGEILFAVELLSRAERLLKSDLQHTATLK